MSNNSRKYWPVTLRIFLWCFTVAFNMYAKFHPCSTSFIGAQSIEVKKKRVFRNTLYHRNFIRFINFLNKDYIQNFRTIVQKILELLRKMSGQNEANVLYLLFENIFFFEKNHTKTALHTFIKKNVTKNDQKREVAGSSLYT